ncbi:MAG: Flp pilus assembly protein CpaB, partial [Pseudomonadota bacterium]
AFEEISGSVVRTPLFENEPILPQKVVLKGDTGYMAALLTPGKRAISIEISAESASGGFILPNDRVDVVVTYREPENFDLSAFADNGVDVVISEDSMTATVLENVRILAIDQIFRQTDTGETAVGRVATLELTPEDAKLLSHTTKEGAVTLLLRSLRDAQAAGDEVISNRFMYDIDQNTRRRTGQVTIYRNGKATTQDEGAGL